MLADYERVVREIRDYVASKPAHGARDLALEIDRIEARNALDEDLVVRALRLYGVVLHEDLRAAARNEPVITPPTGDPPANSGERPTLTAVPVSPPHRPTMTVGGHDVRTNHVPGRA